MLLIYLLQATEHRTLWSSYLFRSQKGYGHSSNQPFCGIEDVYGNHLFNKTRSLPWPE